jgi:hypothetical protein
LENFAPTEQVEEFTAAQAIRQWYHR